MTSPKLKELIEKLNSSKTFKEFIKKNSDAKIYMGLFILDFSSGSEEYILDFKTKNKIFNFNIPLKGEIIFKEGDSTGVDFSKDINSDVKVDLPEVKKIINREMEMQEIKKSIEKIIIILQNLDGRTVWNASVICENLTLIVFHIDALTGEILKFDKKSIFDFIRS